MQFILPVLGMLVAIGMITMSVFGLKKWSTVLKNSESSQMETAKAGETALLSFAVFIMGAMMAYSTIEKTLPLLG